MSNVIEAWIKHLESFVHDDIEPELVKLRAAVIAKLEPVISTLVNNAETIAVDAGTVAVDAVVADLTGGVPATVASVIKDAETIAISTAKTEGKADLTSALHVLVHNAAIANPAVQALPATAPAAAGTASAGA